MRIVHLIAYIQPKLGYQEYFLAKEHAQMGHDITVVTSDRYAPFPDYNNTIFPLLGKRIVGSGRYQCDGFKIIRLKTVFEIGCKVWLKGLRPVILKLRPDIVICHGMTCFYSNQIISLKKKMGFKLIYDDHSLPWVAKRGITGKLFYFFFDFEEMSLCADKIIGIADGCVDVIVEKYNIPRERVEMVPLGADTELFKFEKKLRRDFREKYDIRDDEIVIVYTGRMNLPKAPHNIILAVNNLRNSLNKKVVLLFVGNMEESYRDIFRIHAQSVENFARVIATGMVENTELVRIYSASDIGVWPMQATASTIEALSCSLPVICVDTVKERCKNQNGIAVREGNMEDLTTAILKLVNNDELRIEMGKRSRQLVEKELSWKIIAQRFLEM
ncbi:MAG: hypothetical protein DRP65_00965 [Planctomycetota bacterium]|nr:MAG: hypothetical protein DRP65_00965 [Planctomycetota bacterium]